MYYCGYSVDYGKRGQNHNGVNLNTPHSWSSYIVSLPRGGFLTPFSNQFLDNVKTNTQIKHSIGVGMGFVRGGILFREFLLWHHSVPRYHCWNLHH